MEGRFSQKEIFFFLQGSSRSMAFSRNVAEQVLVWSLGPAGLKQGSIPLSSVTHLSAFSSFVSRYGPFLTHADIQ